MPFCEDDATRIRRHAKSRLGESLLRLAQNLDQTRVTERTAQGQFHQWQERWADHREQISQRLELIDRQLASLAQECQRRPRLSVIAAPLHDEELASAAG